MAPSPMGELLVPGVALLLAVWLAWNVCNLYALPAGLRHGAWRRPFWWVRLLSVSVFCVSASWLRAAFSGGLDPEEFCQLVHHQRYDAAYRAAHMEGRDLWFPLHNRCNADYDMVPSWVNPSIVTFGTLAAVSTVAIIVLVGKSLVATSRTEFE